MSNSKNPLQALQGLTQKRYHEPRPRAASNSNEIYQAKKEAEAFTMPDINYHKKTNSSDSAKLGSFEGHNSAGLSSEFRANKSPNKIRRPTSKGVQSISGSKPAAGVRMNPRETIFQGGFEQIPAEKKAKESDLNGAIKSKLELAYSEFEKEEFDLALMNLTKAEDFLERALNNQEKVPFSTIFLSFYNMAAVHYKQRNLDDCKIFLNNLFLNSHIKKSHEENSKKDIQYNFSNLDDQASYLQEMTRNNLYKKSRCKAHLQACIIFSELESHKEAYIHAKKAAKIAGSLIVDSLMICYHLYLKKLEANDENLEGQKTEFSKKEPVADSNIYINEESEQQSQYINELLPILEEMAIKIKGAKYFSNIENLNQDSEKFQIWSSLRNMMMDQNLNKANMNTLYNGLNESHFLFTMNIMAIAQLQPLEPSKFSVNIPMTQAIQIDSIIEQILLMTVSLYALSTELRFWDEANKKGKPEEVLCDELMNEYKGSSYLKRTSELWIGRSLEFAYTYLPHHAPLAEQIFSIYSKLYSTTKYMIPEDGELNFSMKYLMPARGIVRSAFFFVPLIKKIEKEEENGLLYVLDKDKDLDAITIKMLKQLKLFETKSRYYENLVKNYQNGQKRVLSREGNPELMTLHKQSMALNKIYGKNQVIKGMGMVVRKQYTNANTKNSSGLKEDQVQARTMGNSFYMPAPESSEKDNNSYFPVKTTPDSPQNLIEKSHSRHESPLRPALRKSEERPPQGAFDLSRRVATDEGIYREDRIRLMHDLPQTGNKNVLRPSSPGILLLTANENMKKARNMKGEPRHHNNFIIHQNGNHGNQKHFILENLSLLKEKKPQQVAAEVGQSREANQRRWIRHPADAKIKILHRRATGGGNKENSTSISEVLKTEGASTGGNSPHHFTVESSWYPIATEGSQEIDLKAKKYSIPERGPIRAVTSIRSRVKKEIRSDIEGKSHIINTDLEISDLANSDIKWTNSSLEGAESFKLRSKSIGKKPATKTAVVMIRKGRKIQEQSPDIKQPIFS